MARRGQEAGQPGPAEIGVLPRADPVGGAHPAPGERLPVLRRERGVGGEQDERQRQHHHQDREHDVAGDQVLVEDVDDQDGAQDQAERDRHADPAGHRGALPDRHVVGDGRAQGGVLAVLEGAEQEPQQGHGHHRAGLGQQPQADRGEYGHDERPPVPAAAEPAQPPAVRGPVGQRADDRGGQGGGDGPHPGHHAEGDDLVAGRDVLQLEREHDLRRRLVRHPHAQAGQGEAEDPADPHVLGRFGQRERLHVRLTDHLIPWLDHDASKLLRGSGPTPEFPEVSWGFMGLRLAGGRWERGRSAGDNVRAARRDAGRGARGRTAGLARRGLRASMMTARSPAGSGSCAASRASSSPRPATAVTWLVTPAECRSGRRPPGGGT